MSCTINATAGASDANSYCTIAEANTYHDAHLYADDWTDSDDETRCKALQMATRLLDQWFEWAGVTTVFDPLVWPFVGVSSPSQALGWPRAGVLNQNGFLVDATTVPDAIKNATAEYARQLIAANRTADSDTEYLKSLSAGSVALVFNNPQAKPVPDAVIACVGILGRKRGMGGGPVLLRRG